MKRHLDYKGKNYIVFNETSTGDSNKNTYIIEEVSTGLRIKSFTKKILAVATAKGLEAGMGYAGWTPSFITKPLNYNLKD